MKVKYIIKGLVAAFLIAVIAASCDSYNEALLDGIGNTREFSPVGLKAIVRNQTTVELNWTADEGADHYVVEFSADDPNFTTIFKTVEVTGAQLPVKVVLEGETLYSIRVKAVSATGLENSKWAVTTANTLSEQLFLPILEGDIASKEATLRWVPGSNVTQIVLNPGSITHVITPDEKASGVAKVTGLSPETSYQANLFNNSKKRGATTFMTGIDIGDGILVKNTEDLIQAVANAASGAKLFLEPGDYKTVLGDGTSSTDIVLNKSITITSIPGQAKPVLHYKFTAGAGTSNVSLLNLDLNGTGITNAAVVTINGTASTYGDILLSGCEIHDYSRALISASNAAGSKIASLTVDNCKVTNVNTNVGADFIDVRTAYVASVVLKNSTFNSCSAGRDFIRIDAAAGLTATGLTTKVLVESCTINCPGMLITNRFMYVRFATNECTVKNTLFSNTAAIYSSNQAGTTLPVFSNNNYFNSPNFQNAAIVSNKIDAAGTALDPGFTNAAAGNFTISNQTLIDNKVGDPRWIK